MKRKTPPKSARRRACGRHGQASSLPTPPTGEQKQKKRTYDVLPKPDNLIRYRQNETGRSAATTRRARCSPAHAPSPNGPISRSSLSAATYSPPQPPATSSATARRFGSRCEGASSAPGRRPAQAAPTQRRRASAIPRRLAAGCHQSPARRCVLLYRKLKYTFPFKEIYARVVDGRQKTNRWSGAPARAQAAKRNMELILRCHDDPGLDRRDGKAWQHGQRMRVRASAIVSCLRIVAIEFSTCRSGRIGGASGFGTQG